MAAHTLRSAIQCFGPDSSRCGYCAQPNSSRSYGLWAYRLDVRDYQNMLDAGWRRSGSYLYRPDISSTCCPTYVIRLEASRFVPSSTHKRVLKRFRRYSTHPSPDTSLNNSTHSTSLPPRSDHTHNAVPASSSQPDSSSSSKTDNRSQVDKAKKIEVDRVRLMGIIRSVITECARNKELGPSLSVDRVEDTAQNRIKVFPPRHPISRNGKQHDGCSASAVWCTNAALTLAAAERSLSGNSGMKTPPSAPLTQQVPAMDSSEDHMSNNMKRQRRKRTEEQHRGKARQLAIAKVIEPRLQQAVSIEYSVCVSEPGFLNLFPKQQSNDDTRDQRDDNEDHIGDNGDENRDTAGMEMDLNVRTDITGIAAKDWESAVKKGRGRRIPSSILADDAGKCAIGFPSEQIISPPNEQVSDDNSRAMDDRDTVNNIDDVNNSDNSFDLEDIDSDLSAEFNHDAIQSSFFGTINARMRDGLFSMELVPSKFRADAYEIFRRYQMVVHKESEYECRREAYLKFLVESPLVRERVTASSTDDVWYGSFHIQYKLDGQLFAVGVVDVLPKCLSSVYLFYDPAFGRLSPGILSALKEIEWVQQVCAMRYFPSLKFYYMGYYIHSCPKMRYKVSFYPSELLCDETKNWISSENAKHVMDCNPSGRGARRLAPQGMKSAPEAADFDLADEELDRLTNECRIELNINSPDGRDRRRMSLYTLARTVQSSYLDRVQNLRVLLRRFVQLVGRSSTKFFIHLM